MKNCKSIESLTLMFKLTGKKCHSKGFIAEECFYITDVFYGLTLS